MVSAEGIRLLVEPALTAAGAELWDVEVARDVVRIRLDRPGGVDLDALTSLANQVVSPLLDSRPDLVPTGRYELEVSSPGVERTLRTPDHYRRYIGTEISVKSSVPIAAARRHQGTLISVDDDAIRLDVAGETVEIPFEQIERARTVLVWGPKAAPRSRPKAGVTAKGGDS